MSILVGAETRLITQGITGKNGTFHTLQAKAYGTRCVGGVTPGKGGAEVHGVPVFDTVSGAVEKTGANCTMIFVPAAFAADAEHQRLRMKHENARCGREGSVGDQHLPFGMLAAEPIQSAVNPP